MGIDLTRVRAQASVTSLFFLSIFVSACSTASVSPRAISNEDFEENVVMVGSRLTPADGFFDALMLWNIEQEESHWLIGEELMIPVNQKGIELSLFAIKLPPGKYVFSKSMRSKTTPTGSMQYETVTSYSGNELITSRALKSGDFVYIGRANCISSLYGCTWVMTDEMDADFKLLKSKNPDLPWGNLINRYAKENP